MTGLFHCTTTCWSIWTFCLCVKTTIKTDLHLDGHVFYPWTDGDCMKMYLCPNGQISVHWQILHLHASTKLPALNKTCVDSFLAFLQNCSFWILIYIFFFFSFWWFCCLFMRQASFLVLSFSIRVVSSFSISFIVFAGLWAINELRGQRLLGYFLPITITDL